MHLHDDKDVIIPYQRRFGSDGYIYESYNTVFASQARFNQCEFQDGFVDYKTNYGGAFDNIRCQKMTGCTGDVVHCLFFG